MSRYGMKVADEIVYGIQHPDEALKLIEKIVDQYFGEFWTQHKPRCPLCNTALTDCEKHMNRPVGECTNPKCDSTIHIADYVGKIKDILEEAAIERKQRLEKEAQQASPKSEDDLQLELDPAGEGTASAGQDSHGDMESPAGQFGPTQSSETPDEELIFVW